MAGFQFNYEDKIWGGENLRLSPIHFRSERLRRALISLKKVKGRVLDIGCGAGDFVEAINFYRPDLEAYGLDISEKAIKKAKKRGLKAEFKVGNGEELPYPKNFFDAVLCFDVIEHVEFPEKLISETRRVLKKGGIFQLFIPIEDSYFSFEGILHKLGWKAKEKYGAHPQHYSDKQISRMFKKGRFKMIGRAWGDHFFHQLLEIGYFTALSIRGRNANYSVEGYISQANPTRKMKLIKLIKNCFAVISNTESRIFHFLPGVGLHITYKKDD